MRLVKFLVTLLLIEGLATGAATTKRPSEGKRYLKHSFSPGAFARPGLGAAVTQGTNTPSEWGQGASGYAKRFGSAFGKHLVKRGIQYPVAKMFHEELGYQRSNKKGFGPRLEHALTATVITHKTTTGKRTVAKGELAGAFGSGLISRAWQPASTRGLGLGVASGGITLGADAAGNVAREFWPRHKRGHGSARREARRRRPSTMAAVGSRRHSA